MSDWQDYNVADRLREILKGDHYDAHGHHLGRSFLTGYQLAIEYDRRWPQLRADKGWPLGSAGSGGRASLAQYLARGLSREIRNGNLTDVEGGFLSLRRADVRFEGPDGAIRPSVNNPAIFRLREGPADR